MKKSIIYTVMTLFLTLIISDTNAAVTFLPDYQESELSFDVTYDEPMCENAGIYHKASGCAAPKIFDEYCPHDDDWISECYCPDVFSRTCSHPYRGDTRVTDSSSGHASCDGLWVACCDTTCPSGTTRSNPGGCGGYTHNDCGDTCYYPYEPCCTPESSEVGCSCGTYSCSDGCGGTRTCCSSCPTSDDTIDEGTDNTDDTDGTDNTDDEGTDEEDACTPLSNETSCAYGTENCDDGCGGTRKCCKACTPSADATDCEHGTEDCDDGCGGTRKCCKSAPDCTPKTDETGCKYGTEDCDDDCGGTRQCCKACSDTCSTGSKTKTCTSPMTKIEVGTTECGSTCYDCGCSPKTDETDCEYGTEDCDDGCGGTRKCCKACTPKANETGCTNGTESCDDGCGGTRTCCKACKGYASCTGSTTPCSSSQIKTKECRDCDGTTRYTCEERKCNDSGSYGGSSCSQYSSWAGNCMGGYQMKYTSCWGSGNTPGHGNGDCDVDSWNRCCEQCAGEGPADI